MCSVAELHAEDFVCDVWHEHRRVVYAIIIGGAILVCVVVALLLRYRKKICLCGRQPPGKYRAIYNRDDEDDLAAMREQVDEVRFVRLQGKQLPKTIGKAPAPVAL